MNITSLIINLSYIINWLIPKDKNRIIFYSAPDYSDNCRTIYEKLLQSKRYNNYLYTWVVNDVDKYNYLKNNRCNVVRHRSLKSLWYMSRSRYIFRTHSFWDNKYIEKRQIMCVVWHGMPLKKIAISNRAAKDNRTCDYLISTGSFFDKELAEAVGTDICKVIHSGLPRNDDLNKTVDIYDVLNIPRREKTIIWMPTFRQRSDGAYCDGIESDVGIPLCDKERLGRLDKILRKKNYCLIIKPHQWAANKLSDCTFSNISVLTDSMIPCDISLYNIIGNTDVLITDYSSISVDYLLLNKPMAFVLDDIIDYRKTRGFIIEPIEDYLPGEKIYTFDDLVNWISNSLNDRFYEERKRIKELFYENADFNSTERLLKIMKL